MKLAIYQYCDESQRLPHELSIRFVWCDCAPEPEDAVAMGGESDWKIADIANYEGDSIVECVYIVSLYRDDCPARTKWELHALKNVYPTQSLQVQLADIGSEVLGHEIDFTGQQPTVGSSLVRYGIRENNFVTRREALQVANVVGFLPIDVDKSIPFQRVNLVSYKNTEESKPILQM